MPCSSFRHGMMTVMDWSLYTKLNCSAGHPRYDEVAMKHRAFFLSLIVGTALCASFPELSRVQNVYILPMAGGMDQYLAKSLTVHRQYQVVADPQSADAIFTDRLGEGFERRLVELYPPPPPPEKVAAPSKDAKDGKDSKDEKDKDKDTDKDFVLKEEPMVRMGGFGRSKGNIFLVDRASKKVLWSLYKRPKSTSPDEMNRTADSIVADLQRDIIGKKNLPRRLPFYAGVAGMRFPESPGPKTARRRARVHPQLSADRLSWDRE
jgi:hypothetical protein